MTKIYTKFPGSQGEKKSFCGNTIKTLLSEERITNSEVMEISKIRSEHYISTHSLQGGQFDERWRQIKAMAKETVQWFMRSSQGLSMLEEVAKRDVGNGVKVSRDGWAEVFGVSVGTISRHWARLVDNGLLAKTNVKLMDAKGNVRQDFVTVEIVTFKRFLSYLKTVLPEGFKVLFRKVVALGHKCLAILMGRTKKVRIEKDEFFNLKTGFVYRDKGFRKMAEIFGVSYSGASPP